MMLKIYSETGYMIGYLDIQNDTQIVTKHLHYRLNTPMDDVENLWDKATNELMNENPHLTILAIDKQPETYVPGYVHERRYYAEAGTYQFIPADEENRVVN